MIVNHYAIRAIYKFEMARTFRTIFQSIISPVISTSLYFVVFGSAIGGHMNSVDGVPYGAFIVPGLVMMSLLTQSISNASFGIYFPKFTGTIFELLSAPVSYLEATLAYVGAAASKSIMLGLIILATAFFFVPLQIQHPFWMLLFLLLTAFTFSLFGFIIGIWADGFEKLQMIPMLIITPLTFLGGADAAGIVLGARVPIILTSRADSVRTRLATCAVATSALMVACAPTLGRRKPPATKLLGNTGSRNRWNASRLPTTACSNRSSAP